MGIASTLLPGFFSFSSVAPDFGGLPLLDVGRPLTISGPRFQVNLSLRSAAVSLSFFSPPCTGADTSRPFFFKLLVRNLVSFF